MVQYQNCPANSVVHKIANMKIKNITISNKFVMFGKLLNRAEIASFRPLCLLNNLKGLKTRITLSDLMKPRLMLMKTTEMVAESTMMKSRMFHASLIYDCFPQKMKPNAKILVNISQMKSAVMT